PRGRRGRPDHALELPGRDPGLEAGAGADLRQHDRLEARAGLAADRAAHRAGVRRRGAAAGRLERRDRGRLGKRVQLELGGHNPLIVMADADLARAAEAAYAGAFWSAGQKCTATRRIYIQGTVYDAFRDGLLARIDRG